MKISNQKPLITKDWEDLRLNEKKVINANIQMTERSELPDKDLTAVRIKMLHEP